MTVCPFMSRPVAFDCHDQDGHWIESHLHKVDCLREECAAWGQIDSKTKIINPGATLGFEIKEQIPIYGCRLIGGMAPE